MHSTLVPIWCSCYPFAIYTLYDIIGGVQEQRSYRTPLGLIYSDDLLRLVERLTPAQREAFIAVAEHPSQKEAAEVLGISYIALRVRLCEGRKRIRG